MKKTSIIIAALVLSCEATAQQGMQSNYLGLNIGGGLNTLVYDPADGSNNLGLGFMGELKYIHFFSRHIGLGVGAQINFSHASTTYDFTETAFGLVHPDNGLTYNQKTVYNNWKERQRLTTFNVPIEFYYRNRISQRWSYMIGVGAELNFPISGSYTADEGSYELRADFTDYTGGVFDYHDIPNHGLSSFDADHEADIDIDKMGVSLIAEVGFNRELSNHWGLNFGLYAGYGLTNLIDEASSDPIITLDKSDASKIDYAGTFGSNQVDKLHLLNIGAKVGINLGWNCHSDATAAAAGAAGAAALTSYDQPKKDNQPATQDNQNANNGYVPSMFGNDADDEAEAAAREARCNARRMNDPDMAQARADFEADLAEAERMANECGDNEAANAVADAKAHAADADRAYQNGKYCRAYDLYKEAYGDIANAYAAVANHYAAKTDNIHAAQGAQDAELYAEAAHRDGLDCAIAASRNAKINAEIARDADGSVRGDNKACQDPNYAKNFVNDALALANRSGNKPAITDAKDASGKAYRGNLADAYATAAKSLAESAHAFADRCNTPESANAATEADRHAADAKRAATNGDVQAAHRAALLAKECAYRASRCNSNSNTKPGAGLDANTRRLLDAIHATVYFDFNAATPLLDTKTNAALRALTAAMKSDEGLEVLIVGHTDNVGSAEVNREIGLRRAEAVKSVMVNMGAPAARISTESRGYNEPAASNDTQQNRDLNRRAVITVL